MIINLLMGADARTPRGQHCNGDFGALLILGWTPPFFEFTLGLQPMYFFALGALTLLLLNFLLILLLASWCA